MRHVTKIFLFRQSQGGMGALGVGTLQWPWEADVFFSDGSSLHHWRISQASYERILERAKLISFEIVEIGHDALQERIERLENKLGWKLDYRLWGWGRNACAPFAWDNADEHWGQE